MIIHIPENSLHYYKVITFKSQYNLCIYVRLCNFTFMPLGVDWLASRTAATLHLGV